MRRDKDDSAAAAAAAVATAAVPTADVLDLAIGLGFCVGIVAVYLPQHVQCWRHRTAHGLSLETILLCTVSNVALLLACLLADAEAIQKAYNNNDDRSTWLLRVFGTLNAAIPSLQNVLSIVTGIPTYIFYYFYFGTNNGNNNNNATTASPRGTAAAAATRISPISSSWQHNQQQQQQHRWEVIITAITWLSCGTAIAVTGFVLTTTTHSAAVRLGLQQVWAGVAALTKVLQWMPQIERTWTSGHEGVLSVTCLGVGIVGDGLLAWFWRRSTTHESLWICATLGSDAAMQLILLGLVLQYRRQRRRQAQEQQQHDESAEEVDANSRETTTPTFTTQRRRQRGTNIRWHDDDNDDTHAYNNIVDLRRPLLEDDAQEEEEEEHCNIGGGETTTTPVVVRNGGNLC